MSDSIVTTTPVTVRQINRSVILNLVRLHEPVSRKELSDMTGMVRGNMSAVVAWITWAGLPGRRWGQSR